VTPIGQRSRRSVDRFEFSPADLNPVLAAAAWLSAHRDGWLNLLPGVETDAEPVEAPGLFSIFGSTAKPVSMCTWMPPGRGRRSLDEVTLGIMHARGTRVLPDLAARGIMLAPTWRVWSDHPRRGLVVKIPASADDAEVLGWAVGAGGELCSLPLTGSWQAEVYQPLR
jgi:hypothetical protein